MISVNYTPEMEQAITEASPLDIAKAKDLAEKLGRKPRSIIAKAISMGLPTMQPSLREKMVLPSFARPNLYQQ